MSNVIELPNAKVAPRAERSGMETLILSAEQVSKWKVPPFQRPLSVNAKVRALAVEMAQTEVIPGVVTLGQLKNSPTIYIVDAQHRLEAFKLSGLLEVIADVRVVHFNSMGEMATEYAQLNSSLVKIRPDDLLRAMEISTPALQRIRAECAFVGYDQIRRGTSSPVISMSVLLKCWLGSAYETPGNKVHGLNTVSMAETIDDGEVDLLLRFLHLTETAWGRDVEYARLWQALNLTLCMWLYRRVVLDKTRGVKRAVVLSDSQFKQCIMSLAADRNYLDFLVGRNSVRERDRSPCYDRIRRAFAKRLIAEGNPRPLLPNPPWTTR